MTDQDRRTWRYEKPRAETEAALQRQISNMRRSANAFDLGALEEAERLAASIYIICHDGGRNSRSLLTQLGYKDHMKFPDSARRIPPPERNVASGGPPLLAFSVLEGGQIKWGAPMGDTKMMEWRAFSRWWEETVFVSTRTGFKLSRRNLVFFLRSQEGGAHVDGTLRDEGYFEISRHGDHQQWNELGTLALHSGPIPNAHWHTIRQMTWELDEALILRGF